MHWKGKQKKNKKNEEKNGEGRRLLCGCLGKENEMKNGEEEIGGLVGRVGVVLVLLLKKVVYGGKRGKKNGGRPKGVRGEEEKWREWEGKIWGRPTLGNERENLTKK